MNEVELNEYIKYIKNEIKKSEDPKPKEGFLIRYTKHRNYLSDNNGD